MTRNDLAFCCFLFAAIIACSGHDGWGWMIFAGLLVGEW